MSRIVLFQKEMNITWGIPARDVHIFGEKESIDDIPQAAMTRVRPGYRAYLVKFEHLPPTHLLITACEEAVRNKKVFALPLVAPTKKRAKFII